MGDIRDWEARLEDEATFTVQAIRAEVWRAATTIADAGADDEYMTRSAECWHACVARLRTWFFGFYADRAWARDPVNENVRSLYAFNVFTVHFRHRLPLELYLHVVNEIDRAHPHAVWRLKWL